MTLKSKRITIKEIAETANVSKSTVSRVLNDSTPVNKKKKKAVLDAMEKLNFKPNVFARGLAGGQSMTIGVVTQDIGSPFYDRLTQSLIHSLAVTPYTPLIADGHWDTESETTAINTLVGRQVDGLIIVGGTLTAQRIAEINEGMPTVIVARELGSDTIPSVYADNVTAAFDATQYLIESGHSKIAHITGIISHQDSERRQQGYIQALKTHNIEVDRGIIYEGNFSGPSGILAIESFLSRKATFTALFAANDEMAYGARLALYRKGIRVPEDISIIGFDNQPLSAFVTPPLTTVEQPSDEMGGTAVEVLLSQIKGEEATSEVVQAKLVFRESVLRVR